MTLQPSQTNDHICLPRNGTPIPTHCDLLKTLSLCVHSCYHVRLVCRHNLLTPCVQRAGGKLARAGEGHGEVEGWSADLCPSGDAVGLM